MESITEELGPDCGHLCTLVDEFKSSLQPTPPETPAPAPIDAAQAVAVDAMDKGDDLYRSAIEFVQDWRKGDFSLCSLAECDAKSLEEACRRYRATRRLVDEKPDLDADLDYLRRRSEKPVAKAAPAREWWISVWMEGGQELDELYSSRATALERQDRHGGKVVHVREVLAEATPPL